jgi:hypothetical protein
MVDVAMLHNTYILLRGMMNKNATILKFATEQACTGLDLITGLRKFLHVASMQKSKMTNENVV